MTKEEKPKSVSGGMSHLQAKHMTAFYIAFILFLPALLRSADWLSQGYLAKFLEGVIAFANPMTLNEWGDYLTGTLSPLAIIWLVRTMNLQRKQLAIQKKELRLQRHEMALQRDEMKQARQVWKEQQIEQKRTADAYLEANKIAARAAFSNRFEHMMGIFEELAFQIIHRGMGTKGPALSFFAYFVDSLRHSYSPSERKALRNLGDTLSELDFLNPQNQQIVAQLLTLKPTQEYMDFFRKFSDDAKASEMESLTVGPHSKLYAQLDRAKTAELAHMLNARPQDN